MDLDSLFIPIEAIASILITLPALGQLVFKDWRTHLLLLVLQYLCLFILAAGIWHFSQAITILIAGWSAAAVLWTAMLSLPGQALESTRSDGSSPIFNLLISLIVALSAFIGAPQIQTWIPQMAEIHSWGAFILIGLGLLNPILKEGALPVSIGALSIFSGFTILLLHLTSSQLSAAMIAGVTLTVALAGAYLLLVEPTEATP